MFLHMLNTLLIMQIIETNYTYFTHILTLMKIYFLVMKGKRCRIPTSRLFSSPVPTDLSGHVMSHQNSPHHTGHKRKSILLFLRLYLKTR